MSDFYRVEIRAKRTVEEWARIPAYLALILVPLTIGAKTVTISGAYFVDLYSWYKAALLIVLGAVAGLDRLPRPWIILYILASCLFSRYPDTAWWGFPNQYLGGLALLGLFALAANPPTENEIVKALVYGSVPISLLTIFPMLIPWDLLAPGHVVEFAGNSAASTLYNANYVGLYVATVFPILAAKKHWFSSAMLAAALAASHSLSGIVGAAAALIVYLWATDHEVVAGICVAAVSFVTMMEWKPGFDGRLEIWRESLKLTSAFGSGPGSFPLEYPQTSGAELVDKPHSFYIQTVHAFGWIGAAFGVTELAFVLRPKSLAFTVGLIGFAVAAICNDLYIGVAPILFIILGRMIYDSRPPGFGERAG